MTLKSFSTRKKQVASTDAQSQKRTEHIVTPLRDDEVFSAWFALINQLPQEHKAMAVRMKNMKPVITSESTLEVTVNSERVADYMRELSQEIEQFLRSRLKNDETHLDIKVAAAAEVERIISKPERYKIMLSKNAALRELAQSLKLELD